MSTNAHSRHPLSWWIAAVIFVFMPSRCEGDNGPYCGIYAIYGAASALGADCDFESLVDERFVSGRTGSSVADLLEAADHIGVKANPMTGLGLASLRESRDPLILHVASLGQLVGYNHWILFLGMEDGRGRTVDSSGSVHLMNVAELMTRWDGVGIAVFRNEAPLTNFGSVELAALSWFALLVLFAIGAAAVLIRRYARAGQRRNHAWAGGLVGIVILLAVTREANPGLSLWRNPECVNYLRAALGQHEFPLVSIDEVAAMTRKPGYAVIFDARYDGDMAYGHIPGALPLPIDYSQFQIAQQVAGIDRERTIVVYCQSDGCRFSDRMAVVLTSFGFTDIRICRDGWVGWKKYRGPRENAK